MLIGEDGKQGTFEIVELLVVLPGDRYGLAFAGRGLLLDVAFYIVVIDVVCLGGVSGLRSTRQSGEKRDHCHVRCDHAGMDLWRSVSPYFMPLDPSCGVPADG